MKVPYLCICECGGAITNCDTIDDYLLDNPKELGFAMQGKCSKCGAIYQWHEIFVFDRVENLEKMLDRPPNV
jgi:hypothetical protein